MALLSRNILEQPATSQGQERAAVRDMLTFVWAGDGARVVVQ